MESVEAYERRLKNVEKVMIEKGIGCLLLNQTQAIDYLTGANNTCSWVFLANDGRRIALVLESDYQDYKKQSILEDIRVFTPHDPLMLFKEIPNELKLSDQDLAIEKDHLKYSQYEMIGECLGSKISSSVNATLILEEARITKTPEEIEAIQKAAQMAMLGFRFAEKIACQGMTESKLAHDTYEAMLRAGAGHSTYIYLASDGRSSLAHTPPKDNVLRKGPIVLDIHATYKGYHADMARTLFIDDNFREPMMMYDILREKVLETIHSLKEGTTLVEAKRVFYKGLKKQDDWILLTGPLLHGVGIVNYELPKLDHPFEGQGYPEKLASNMVLACSNIGMYSSQGWGVRYEDTFIVQKDGVELLTI